MYKIHLLIILSAFWRLGGTNKKAWCRDVLIPIILGAYIGWTYNWVVGFFTIASFQIIRMGYGAYDPEHDDKPSWLASITHDRQGWINRAVVGLLYALCGILPLFIYWVTQGLVTNHFLTNWSIYMLINILVGGILCKLKARDIIIEPAIGAGVATLFWLF